MTQPTLCIAFNNVDDSSSIGKLCAWAARSALQDGWNVTVVARDVDASLVPHVEWLPLYVPPRLHAVQWYSARAATKRAVAGRAWDVMHVQQPQLSGMADVLHLHYLVRAARLAAPEQPGQSLGRRARNAQTRLTEAGETWAFRHLPKDLELVFVSDLLQREFARNYGPHPRGRVLSNPAPVLPSPVTEAERAAARASYGLHHNDLVIGFLGGADPRKGGLALLDALPDRGVRILLGGAGVPDHPGVTDSDLVVRCGYVDDLRRFFAACDALAAVSTFDPAPLAPLEALAHGVPVVGTAGCGGVADMIDSGCGLLWARGSPLGPVADRLRIEKDQMRAAALAFAQGRSETVQRVELLKLYHQVCERKRATA